MKRLIKSVVLVTALTLPHMIMPNTEFGITEQIVTAESETPKEHAQSVVSTLAEMYPEDTLPTYVLTADLPEYVTAATTGVDDQDNFNIFYYAEDTPFEVNDPAVNRLTPIASLTKTTYQTEEAAIEAVNQVLDLQGDEVDLGYDITGYLQGAAGSTYLNWKEGNWSLLIQANNMNEEDPVPLAESVVKYLEEVYLPEPSSVGQVRLSPAEGETYVDNTVVWQEDNVVYQVKHIDPMQAVVMTGSISEPTEQ
ncbi:MAG: hypothetical protein ACTHX4_07925 [Ruoffia tabacinasalis]